MGSDCITSWSLLIFLLCNWCSQNSKGGATVQNLLDEVSLYDMKAFSAATLYISGNDAASGKDPEWIADKYDQLISLVQCSNNDCRIILCSLVPRGDVDVTKMNQIISELATHWSWVCVWALWCTLQRWPTVYKIFQSGWYTSWSFPWIQSRFTQRKCFNIGNIEFGEL